jgi:hypothetical protein
VPLRGILNAADNWFPLLDGRANGTVLLDVTDCAKKRNVAV